MKLTTEGCRARQQRLVQVLADRGLDGAIIARRDHVYYFTGHLSRLQWAAAALVRASGDTVLVSAEPAEGAAADEQACYDANPMATTHSRQFAAVAETLRPFVGTGRFGADLGGGAASVVAPAGAEAVDLTDELYRLRKRKEPDEVAAIAAAISLTDAMYEAADVFVRPGISEVDVFAELLATATRAAGSFLERFGNDFRANAAGGAPRQRLMRVGELYILDAGPSLDGYHADNCRTFVVGPEATEAQRKAWETLDGLFPQLEAAAKPGMPAADLYMQANEYLREAGYGGLPHHLGHGVGLEPHEAPQLNPEYEATLEVGDVFTLEPGIYAEELQAGIRLEENYRMTETGVEKLTSRSRRMG
jgi:Xaa-Pro aminopeptidase